MTEPTSPLPDDAHPEDLAELALGIEEPARRAPLLGHLARCPRCRAEVAELGDLADRLAVLAPPAATVPGFEARALDRLGAAGAGVATPSDQPPLDPVATVRRRRRHRQPRRILRTALVAAVAAAAAAAGVAVAPGRAGGRVEMVRLEASGGPVGDLLLYRGPSPWVSMWVRGRAGEALTCEVQSVGGATIRLGTFVVGAHGGYWAAPVPPSALPVRAARLVGPSGQVVASARL